LGLVRRGGVVVVGRGFVRRSYRLDTFLYLWVDTSLVRETAPRSLCRSGGM